MLFFGITPLLLIASGAKNYSNDVSLTEGTFQFEFSGVLNEMRVGSAAFTMNTVIDEHGKDVKSLALTFTSKNQCGKELIEFIISPNAGVNSESTKGVYKIKNLNQFMHGLNGVYGYADINEWSELPFFVKNGSISINANKEEAVIGSLEVNYENAAKEALFIRGSFNAN